MMKEMILTHVIRDDEMILTHVIRDEEGDDSDSRDTG